MRAPLLEVTHDAVDAHVLKSLHILDVALVSFSPPCGKGRKIATVSPGGASDAARVQRSSHFKVGRLRS